MPWQTTATLIFVAPFLALSLADLAAEAVAIVERVRAERRAADPAPASTCPR